MLELYKPAKCLTLQPISKSRCWKLSTLLVVGQKNGSGLAYHECVLCSTKVARDTT
jgi:hypothetical protein